MKHTPRERTLALAGVFQAALITQQLARRGSADTADFEVAVASTLRRDAATTEAVFGGAAAVATGLELVRDKLGDRTDPSDLEIARYVIGMLQLERRLMNDQTTLKRLSEGLERIQGQDEYFRKASGEDEVHTNVIASLAELYQETLSNLPPRIIVNGEPEHLSNQAVVARIRTALLAGVRAAVLWRQLGGRRWHLLLQRGRYVAEAGALLESMK
jgi:high frequency lysogenization protein